ncbi:MAG: hypothetical protein WAX38_05020 [Minisyncoccia bacterium]
MNIFSSWTFTWWQAGLLKSCCVSCGILLALYFSEYLAPFIMLWWVVFVSTAVYFLYLFIKHE